MYDLNKMDIAKRMWLCYGIPEGFVIFPANPEMDVEAYMPGHLKRYNCTDIASLSEYYVPGFDMVKKTAGLKIPKAIVFNNKYDFFKVMTEWDYQNKRLKQNPFLLYERFDPNSVRLCATICFCAMDYNFVIKNIPNSEALYRNKASMTTAFTTARPIVPSRISDLWMAWGGKRNVPAVSRRFFSETLYGYPTQPNLLRLRNLYTAPIDDSDPDITPYTLLYTLSISTEEIKELQNMGFVWNRYCQAWVISALNMPPLRIENFIMRDSLSSPEMMRFVPAWYAEMEVNKTIGHKDNTRSGDFFDNMELWKKLI